MSEMSDKEKLFIFMAHADELQKIADASHKELQAAAVALKEMVKELPVELRGFVVGSLTEIAESRLVKPVERAGAQLGQIMATARIATKGLWLYPTIILAITVIALTAYAYLGVTWVMAERDRARAELAAINHELAQTANVRKFTTEEGEDQFWVEIDPVKKTGDTDGKTWARMPRR